MPEGKNPAVAVNQSTGEEFVATWKDPGWDVYRRLPGEDSFSTGSVHIVDAPEAQAGMAFLPTSDGALVFEYFDGDGRKRKYSRDLGEHWTDE